MSQPTNPPDAEEYEEEEVVRDDAAIGRALRISGVLFVFAALLGGLAYAIFSRPAAAPQVAPAPLRVPQRRPAPQMAVPAVPLVNVAAEAGIDFQHHNLAAGKKLLPETMGGGCAFLDYDNDGDQDLLLVDSNRWPWDPENPSTPAAQLYANDGAGHFTNVTDKSGLNPSCYGMGCAVGDYDNDGDPDLYFSAVGENCLYRNDRGKFVNVTESAGVAGDKSSWSTSCGWFDYDNDGDLDLLVANYVTWSPEIDLQQDFRLTGIGRAYGPPFSFAGSCPDLYRNNGDGTFAEVSQAAGLRVVNVTGAPLAKSLGVRPLDLDGDGWLDFFIANDTVQNLLFMNNRDGTFREVGADVGVAFNADGKARGAMGVDAAWFRGDQAVALAVANFANEMTGFYVSADQGRVFTDDAIPTGIGPRTRTNLSFGILLFDADLDGRPDLFSANGHIEGEIERVQKGQQYRQPCRLFWNSGARTGEEFLPVAASPGLELPLVGRGAAYSDIDADGDLDVLVTQIAGPPALLRNDQTLGHHFLRLKLVGTQCNRDAIGAVVEAVVGGQPVRHQVIPTRSYLSQVELPVTIGLGAATEVEKLTIRWPGGGVQAIDSPTIDKLIVVTQTTKPPAP